MEAQQAQVGDQLQRAVLRPVLGRPLAHIRSPAQVAAYATESVGGTIDGAMDLSHTHTLMWIQVAFLVLMSFRSDMHHVTRNKR